MEGEFDQLSDGLRNYLITYKEELEKTKSMGWDELRVVTKEASLLRKPGENVHSVADLLCIEDDRRIKIRLYQPEGYHLPIIVYFHGGGWVLGDLDTQDPFCRKLANHAKCAVISVDYSLSPENPYPAPINDGLAVVKWIMKNAKKHELDYSRVIFAGDGAGGEIATVLANKCSQDQSEIGLIHQILIYPVTDIVSFDTISHKKFGSGYYLETEMMKKFSEAYMRLGEKGDRLHASPLYMPFVYKCPPSTVITAGFDPLRDEGRKYAERLRQCKIDVNYINYENMIHDFLQFTEFDPSIDTIIDEIIGLFKEAAYSQ